MDEEILIDVEEPHRELLTIPLAQAIEDYNLNQEEVEDLKGNFIVWFKDVALSLHKEL